jgi:hypothetical protein
VRCCAGGRERGSRGRKGASNTCNRVSSACSGSSGSTGVSTLPEPSIAYSRMTSTRPGSPKLASGLGSSPQLLGVGEAFGRKTTCGHASLAGSMRVDCMGVRLRWFDVGSPCRMQVSTSSTRPIRGIVSSETSLRMLLERFALCVRLRYDHAGKSARGIGVLWCGTASWSETSCSPSWRKLRQQRAHFGARGQP